jgi:hypothetical protein
MRVAVEEVDLGGAEVYVERGGSIALGKWHVKPGEDGQPDVYFVPDDSGQPRKALIKIEMLLDTRFERIA